MITDNHQQSRLQRLAPAWKALLATVSMYFVFNFINNGWTFYFNRAFIIEFTLAYLHVFAVLLGIDGFDKFFNKRFGHYTTDLKRYFSEVTLVLLLNIVIFTIVYLLPILLLYYQKTGSLNNPILAIRIRQSYMIASVLALILYGQSKITGLYKHLRFTEMEAERIKKERAMHQFETLKNQVNPHFLFNSLNALSSLITINKDQAARFVDELSVVYRYVLDQKDNELVRLRKEVSFIDSYLYLLEVRYRKSLQCKYNFGQEMLDFELPPLTLQLLIDNAIQHNSMSKESPLIINCDIVDNALVICHNEQARSQVDQITALSLNDLIARYEYLTEIPVKTWRENNHFYVKVPLLKIES